MSEYQVVAAADIRAAAAALPGARAAPGPPVGALARGPWPAARAPGPWLPGPASRPPRRGSPGPLPRPPRGGPVGLVLVPTSVVARAFGPRFLNRPGGSFAVLRAAPPSGPGPRAPVRGPSCPGCAVGPAPGPPPRSVGLPCRWSRRVGLGPRSLALWGPGVPAPAWCASGLVPRSWVFPGPGPPLRGGCGPPGARAAPGPRLGPSWFRCARSVAFRVDAVLAAAAFSQAWPAALPGRRAPWGPSSGPLERCALRVYRLPNCQPAPQAPKPGAPIPPAAPMLAGPVKAKQAPVPGGLDSPRCSADKRGGISTHAPRCMRR